MRVTVVLAVLSMLLVGCSLAFALDPGVESQVRPVAFSETLTTGLTGVDVQQAHANGYEIPRVQVFFTQYQYVLGYYGIDAAVRALDRAETSRQFGRPLAIYVTTYDDAGVELTENGSLTVASDPRVDWVRARAAHFVVGSGARTPGGPAVVPFEERDRAAAFAARHGGRVRTWDELAARDDEDHSPPVRDRIADRRAWASRTVAAQATVLDRPVSIVVGRDEPTLAAAIRAAPPNTTVRVPPGTYRTNLTIDKPVTLRGAGARTRIVGTETGTVLRVTADRVGIANLSLSGVGDEHTAEPDNASRSDSEWDSSIRRTYGYGDAAVVLAGANDSLLVNLRVETPANGIVLRYSDGTVIRKVTVEGSDRWQDGFMSVLAMYSRIVVEDSHFVGGRDAVYTHRADGIVVRDNRMVGMRFGVHEMFTSGSLVANNTVRETNIGIVIMTRPRSNAALDNRVTDSEVGISVSGSASIVTGNVVVDNRYGMDIGTQRSVYTRNLIAGNGIGLRTGTIVPTNRVRANDVVGNDRHVLTGRGPVRVWAGNYWGPTPGWDRDGDGTIERPFRPRGVVDRRVARSDAAGTLAGSPAVALVRHFETALPGLRSAAVVDTAPRADPANPDAVAAWANETGWRADP